MGESLPAFVFRLSGNGAAELSGPVAMPRYGARSLRNSLRVRRMETGSRAPDHRGRAGRKNPRANRLGDVRPLRRMAVAHLHADRVRRLDLVAPVRAFSARKNA